MAIKTRKEFFRKEVRKDISFLNNMAAFDSPVLHSSGASSQIGRIKCIWKKMTHLSRTGRTTSECIITSVWAGSIIFRHF